MSLIRAALRQSEGDGQRSPAKARAGDRATYRHRRDLLGIAVGVVFGLSLAYGVHHWRAEQTPELVSVAPLAETAGNKVNAMLAHPPLAQAQVASQPPSLSDAKPEPVVAALNEPTLQPESQVAAEALSTPLPEPVADAPAGANTSSGVASTDSIQTDDAPESRRQPVRIERIDQTEVETMGPEQRLAALRRSLHAGQRSEAEQHLLALHQMLPSASLTRLRVDAWWARETEQSEQAISHYREIRQRLPDDLDAGLNLASLYWQTGRSDSAREVVRELRERYPDVAQVDHYWSIMRPQRSS